MPCPACGAPISSRLHVNASGCSIIVDGHMIPVSPMEARIMDILRRNEGFPVTPNAIADILGTSQESIRVLVTKLRERLRNNDSDMGIELNGYMIKWAE